MTRPRLLLGAVACLLVAACAMCDVQSLHTSWSPRPGNPTSPNEAYWNSQVSGYISQTARYPLAACRAGQQGSVAIDIFFTARGEIDRATLARSSGFPLLDAEALATWERLKDNGAKFDIPKDDPRAGNSFVFRLTMNFRNG